MDEADRQRIYDEVVEADSVTAFFAAMYDHCETPEEMLASALVERAAYTLFNLPATKRFTEFAAVRWPWGDARGLQVAGGRTYWEARLRLRDKLVDSARELAKQPAGH